MRPGITGQKIQAVPDPLRRGDLQAVIVRVIPVLKKVDELKKWKLRIEGPPKLLTCVVELPASGCSKTGLNSWQIGIGLIDVAHAVKFHAGVSHISDLDRGRISNCPLDVGIPRNDVGRSEMAIHAQDIAGRTTLV